MVVRGQERRQGHDATRTRHAWLQHWRGSSALSYIFDSRKHRKKRGTITMDALRMLEKAAVSIKSGELGECRWRGENWDRGCWGWNINASACVFLVDDLRYDFVFSDLRRFTSGNFIQQVMNGKMFARLPRDAFRVDSVVATL